LSAIIARSIDLGFLFFSQLDRAIDLDFVYGL